MKIMKINVKTHLRKSTTGKVSAEKLRGLHRLKFTWKSSNKKAI